MLTRTIATGFLFAMSLAPSDLAHAEPPSKPPVVPLLKPKRPIAKLHPRVRKILAVTSTPVTPKSVVEATDDVTGGWQRAVNQMCCPQDLHASTTACINDCADMTARVYDEPPRVACLKTMFSRGDPNDIRKKICSDDAVQTNWATCVTRAAANNKGYKPEFRGDPDRLEKLDAARLACFHNCLKSEEACRPSR